jgi:hypothetical protein
MPSCDFWRGLKNSPRDKISTRTQSELVGILGGGPKLQLTRRSVQNGGRTRLMDWETYSQQSSPVKQVFEETNVVSQSQIVRLQCNMPDLKALRPTRSR